MFLPSILIYLMHLC